MTEASSLTTQDVRDQFALHGDPELFDKWLEAHDAEILDGAERRVAASVKGFVNDMFANIPLLPPDPAWDPNDEFKRCAVDRADRARRAGVDIVASVHGQMDPRITL